MTPSLKGLKLSPNPQSSLHLRTPTSSFFQIHNKLNNFQVICRPSHPQSLKITPLSWTYKKHVAKIGASIKLEDGIPPNALSRKVDPQWRGGFSLGVDLGLSRTGLALSKGYTFRPLTVLNLRGQKLELRLLDIAEQEEADEFIIGLPKSSDGKETTQSNKVRSVAGRLAVRAAERGWRVYLQDEYGSSVDAMHRMINLGVNKSSRQGKIDAYAAVMVLERYFSRFGEETELVLPKQSELQDKIRKGPPEDDDFF